MLKLLLLSFLILGCILSAILVVFALNPIHAVFFLIIAFLCSSGLLFLHGTYFFALVLLIVYVGAVAVLFLFVIMMLDTKKVTSEREGFKKEVFLSFQKIFFFFRLVYFFCYFLLILTEILHPLVLPLLSKILFLNHMQLILQIIY